MRNEVESRPYWPGGGPEEQTLPAKRARPQGVVGRVQRASELHDHPLRALQALRGPLRCHVPLLEQRGWVPVLPTRPPTLYTRPVYPTRPVPAHARTMLSVHERTGACTYDRSRKTVGEPRGVEYRGVSKGPPRTRTHGTQWLIHGPWRLLTSKTSYS